MLELFDNVGHNRGAFARVIGSEGIGQCNDGSAGLGRLLDGIDSDAFAKRLLADPYRTFLLPGSAYGQANHIRLGVGGGAGVNLSKGLDQVSLALRDWQRRG